MTVGCEQKQTGVTSGGQSGQRLEILDVLRIVAALMVVVHHYAVVGFVQHLTDFHIPAWEAGAKYGYLGVPLFFVISGFVISMSAQNRTARQFAAARATRLYPAYWIACTLTFALLVVWGDAARMPFSKATYAFNLTMVEGLFGKRYLDVVYWTLTEELKFYILIFLLLVSGQMRHYEKTLWAWLIVCALFLAFGGQAFGRFASVRSALWSPFFIAGGVYYLAYSDKWTTARILLALASVVCSLAGICIYTRIVFEQAMPLPYSLYPPIALVLLIHFTFALITRGLNTRTDKLLLLANLTYPLYLLHEDAGFILFNHLRFGGIYVRLAIVFGLVLLASYAVHLCERPISRVLKRLLGGAGT